VGPGGNDVDAELFRRIGFGQLLDVVVRRSKLPTCP